MQLDLGTKAQHDNRHTTRRINNEGRLVGTRVRHVTWLHTYCKRKIISPEQFRAGDRLCYLWNHSTINLPARTINLLRIWGGRIAYQGDGMLPAQLRQALGSIKRPNAKEAVIDLCVFDISMGIGGGRNNGYRVRLAKEGLDCLAVYFKAPKNHNPYFT